jgi:hypothetical protein
MVRTIIHFFPSRANLAGFLVERDWGFAGLDGFLLNEGGVLLGAVEESRNAGFLCVISLFSTLRNPFVTSAPRLSSANTAATPPEPGACTGDGPGAGGGGGGGGRGAPSVTGAALYSLRDMPLGEGYVMVATMGEKGRIPLDSSLTQWCGTPRCALSNLPVNQ